MSEEGSNDGLVESQVIQDTEQEERPEPAEIRSPSDEGGIDFGDDDDDGHRDDDEQEQSREQQGDEVEEEDVLINTEPSEEVVNGVNDDDDEDQLLPSMNPKRLLDSDEEDDNEKSSPIKSKRILDSDDEDGDGEPKSVSPRKRIIIPDDDSDDDDDELKKLEARVRDSDDEAEPDGDSDVESKTRTTIEVDNDDDADEGADAAQASAEGDEETGKSDVIAHIFGESGDEDEDFEGFKKQDDGEDGVKNDGEGGGDGISQVAADLQDSSSDDDGERRSSQRSDLVYDFDIMMQKKREENYRRRKRKNIDIINDSDDVIAEMIQQMKQAAEDDFNCNKENKPALHKLKLLPKLEGPLKKIDLREALLDAGILSVITDWLTPLPDRSLPNIKVREVMLTVLQDFHINDTERLKASGIGKAVMYLFKHPKETKDNKLRAHKLIQMWSRPIFNNETDFHSISREEREQRDIDLLSSAKKSRVEDTPKKSQAAERVAGPGEKGFIPRARVPAPSLRAYATRPQSKVEMESSASRASSKKQVSRLEKLQRQMMDKKRASRGQRPVKVSIEGRKM